MKIVYMGTSEFAVPCLSELAKHHTIVGVITQPDRPKGRGMKLQPTPVKARALELDIPVWQPQKIRSDEGLELLKSLEPELIVVVSYGQILPKSVLELPKHGCINVHASLLPEYRGAAPIHWSILNGETETGVTTMFMDEGLDTGDMLLRSNRAIPMDWNVGLLHDTLAEDGAVLLTETLKALEQGTLVRTSQDRKAGSYAPMIGRELAELDWACSAKHLHNRVRGLNPWPAAQTSFDGQRIKIFCSEPVDVQSEQEPGTVVESGPHGILISTGNGLLNILEVQAPGGKRMHVSAFLLGHPVEKGSKFGENNGS